MVLIIFIASRFFGGFCRNDASKHEGGINDLRNEIQSLRDEIRELKNKNKK